MNKKIFTLLACALMLFSTAFTVNAKIIGGSLSVGDTVRTLPSGLSAGMYHIRIDSICVDDGLGEDGIVLSAPKWVPVGGATGDYDFDGPSGTVFSMTDTVVLGVNEHGRVVPVSMHDLRHKNAPTANYTDLQAVMWCTDVVEDGAMGQWPTFRFTNKVFGEDLDFAPGTTFIGGQSNGWRFSQTYNNENLQSSHEIHRLVAGKKGHSVVLTHNLRRADGGFIQTREVRDDSLMNRTVRGALKFTIVEVAPVVLDADAFNSKLGQNRDNSLVKLKFNPEPNSTEYPNFFGYSLKAVTATQSDTHGNNGRPQNQYLNLLIDGKAGNYIYNILDEGEDNPKRYTNELGIEHLRILGDGEYNSKVGMHNKAYRFVYFPSKDSVVINALAVAHFGHNSYAPNLYVDDYAYYGGSNNYLHDTHTPPAPLRPIYYGLYTENIHDNLIVIRQDLAIVGGPSLIVIGKHPANVRISFGLNGCEEIELDAWVPDNGVYTIWDERGRVLGVRIYNGSLSPQWMELEPGECPDRIPSYQWVIERAQGRSYGIRVNIKNREFGHMKDLLVNIDNVLIKTYRTQIFLGKGQFAYEPLNQNAEQKYVPINYGWVVGRYLDVDPQTSCKISESSSGFRPVNNAYTQDQYLGYKHFYVDTDPTSVSYGKSDDMASVTKKDMTEKGMDYNAFAFNYYHYTGDEFYIDMKTNYYDTMLHVNPNGGKEGFQFMLGANLRGASNNYATEKYGHPRKKTNYTINMGSATYKQTAPVLERYYYELKVADFYDYREGLREEFVILKGAFHDNVDVNNKLKYGVADTLAQHEPFKYANVYLRETYFLPKELKLNEERKYQDPSRRTYYAIMDRIEEDQLQRVTDMGLQVSDELMSLDESSKKYNLVIWRVDDMNEWIKAQGKVVSSVRVSTFALENMNYPLYRRLCSIEDDGASDNGDGAPMPYDAPKTLRFYTQENNVEYLFEDALSGESANKGGINFLGLANSAQFNEDFVSADGFRKFNYNIFVDTAYINRGTGWIKPQYLLAVGETVVNDPEPVTYIDDCGDEQQRVLRPYIRARYLVNATDSARRLGSNGSHTYPERDPRYITSQSWDRLIFVDAIHVDDRLYLVGQMKHFGVNESDFIVKAKDGKMYVDGEALYKMTEPGGILHGTARRPQVSGMLGSYYDFDEWNNYHNDVCFSLRFTKKEALNASEFTGEGGADNDTKRFWIESETFARNPYGNRKIAPVQGGWVKIDNGAAVLSRTSYEDGIAQGEIFNVEKGTREATATETVETSSKVRVVSGIGEVSVLNANGKNLTITNMLGQTISSKVLDSDNVTVKASKGIVVVTIEGEKAVKSIVK